MAGWAMYSRPTNSEETGLLWMVGHEYLAHPAHCFPAAPRVVPDARNVRRSWGLFRSRPCSRKRCTMLMFVKRFVREEEGATMVEYGLMVALIAIVCIVAVALVGTNLNGQFGAVAASVGS